MRIGLCRSATRPTALKRLGKTNRSRSDQPKMAHNGATRRNGAMREERSGDIPAPLWQEGGIERCSWSWPGRQKYRRSFGQRCGNRRRYPCALRESEHRACGALAGVLKAVQNANFQRAARPDMEASSDVVVHILIMNTV